MLPQSNSDVSKLLGDEDETDRAISRLSPARILWHPWAIEDAMVLERRAPHFGSDTQTWVELKAVARILRDWPTATRILVTGWYVPLESTCSKLTQR